MMMATLSLLLSSKLDGWLWMLQLLSVVVFIGGAGLGVWNAIVVEYAGSVSGTQRYGRWRWRWRADHHCLDRPGVPPDRLRRELLSKARKLPVASR